MESIGFPRKGGYFQPQSCICSVQYNENKKEESKTGTGAFYKVLYPDGTPQTLFITNNHVAPIRDKNDVTKIKLVFQDTSIGNVNFTPDWVKEFWTSPQCLCDMKGEKSECITRTCLNLDVTIIELSPIAISILSPPTKRTNFHTLNVTLPKLNEQVSVYQYPGGIFHVGKGTICSLHGVKFKYRIDSKAGSSGSPILNNDCLAVGIHSGMNTDGTRKGVNICVILAAFQKCTWDASKGRVDNEKELEWINQLPKSALTLIEPGGCGKKAQFGYGKVYKVPEQNSAAQSSSFVALKIIEGFGGLDTLKEQITELQTVFERVKSLPHIRIIKLHEFVKDDLHAKLILKMEYLEGGSLVDKIDAKGGKLDKQCSLNYLSQILEGVKFLHSQKPAICHGDIKPSNILFISKDKDDIKLSDIGIAVRLQFASSTTIGQRVLRRDSYYMSPERINGEPISTGDDIWSIGATFVKMLTGKTINHNEKFPQIHASIFQNKITIDGLPLSEYLKSIKDKTDYRVQIISQVLCPKESRLDAEKLFFVVERCRDIK